MLTVLLDNICLAVIVQTIALWDVFIAVLSGRATRLDVVLYCVFFCSLRAYFSHFRSLLQKTLFAFFYDSVLHNLVKCGWVDQLYFTDEHQRV